MRKAKRKPPKTEKMAHSDPLLSETKVQYIGGYIYYGRET
jgi:hypothetical protein